MRPRTWNLSLEFQLSYLQVVWPWAGLSELWFRLQTGKSNSYLRGMLGG